MAGSTRAGAITFRALRRRGLMGSFARAAAALGRSPLTASLARTVRTILFEARLWHAGAMKRPTLRDRAEECRRLAEIAVDREARAAYLRCGVYLGRKLPAWSVYGADKLSSIPVLRSLPIHTSVGL
jgi:hypothetical protein